ncbi:hypothetical protein SJA_C1-12590 [Sphingobium indicum UT26S]|uniref:Uncharacterized protein n=1 Tax=Sphingobium indicum (strain DSM 16413 / CCM 7287 / MTCC 6362 / UT26 / NBRC 101211 / UT26S) TaxID=452662 RepID=D4Z0G1_SPHIU|nr:hypothetical protein SJA_C1-12590 [Sphingobium indicum UT26S]
MDRSPSQAALRRRWVRLAWGLNRDPHRQGGDFGGPGHEHAISFESKEL